MHWNQRLKPLLKKIIEQHPAEEAIRDKAWKIQMSQRKRFNESRRVRICREEQDNHVVNGRWGRVN